MPFLLTQLHVHVLCSVWVKRDSVACNCISFKIFFDQPPKLVFIINLCQCHNVSEVISLLGYFGLYRMFKHCPCTNNQYDFVTIDLESVSD